MHFESFFFQAFVYLTAAVIAVPIAKRLGLGSVLGYLLAGVVIGPYVLGLVGSEGEGIMHFAEFGVVMMLFLVGLELQPALLWRLRGPIVGSGGLQIGMTMAVGTAVGLLLGWTWQTGLAVGLILAMSSTAIVLQTLNEKGLMQTHAGQNAFSVLLFQDIAVIPMLALLPLLAMHGGETLITEADGHGGRWDEGFAPWARAVTDLGAVAVIVLAGRYGLRPIFRIIAKTGVRELFTALALLLVVGIALLMSLVGLSPALGTFLAGVVLANSEYRHELESDIQPFKGLLLGLFFIAVGASINFILIGSEPILIAGLVIALVFGKGIVLAIVGRIGRMTTDQNLVFSVSLAQGGEFCFVLLAFAAGENVLSANLAETLVATVALSMALSPVLFTLMEKGILPRFGTREANERQEERPEKEMPVILAGFGRFGNVVGRLLRANGIEPTILDHDSDQVDVVRKFGIRAYYGDATRKDLLDAAGAAKAKILIIALDDPERSLQLVALAQRHYPNLTILARAIDRDHAYSLVNQGVAHVFHETTGSAVDMGIQILRLAGERAHRAHRIARQFKASEYRNMFDLARHTDDRKAMLNKSIQAMIDLEDLIKTPQADHDRELEGAWNDASIRKEVSRKDEA